MISPDMIPRRCERGEYIDARTRQTRSRTDHVRQKNKERPEETAISLSSLWVGIYVCVRAMNRPVRGTNEFTDSFSPFIRHKIFQ